MIESLVIPQPSKAPLYYSSVRSEIIPLIAHYRDLVTLDVGCGQGTTSAMLRNLSISRMALGIEYSPDAAERARSVVDSLKIGDVETMDLSEWKGQVDLLLCLDVLEHLRDPWAALRKLSTCLKPGGRIIASVPNVQNKSVVLPLLRGQWNYAEYGQLDRTHLRFFTHRTARNLIESAGFTIDAENIAWGGRASKYMNLATLGMFRGFFTWQFLIRGVLSLDANTLNRAGGQSGS